jgi:hypothetical protein
MEEVLDSQTIAIMTQVNELANRMGIQPYQVSVVLEEKLNDQERPWKLSIAGGSAVGEPVLKSFIQAITGNPRRCVLETQSPAEMLKKVCDAVHVAPQRQRGVT